jgi:hypothetical protein
MVAKIVGFVKRKILQIKKPREDQAFVESLFAENNESTLVTSEALVSRQEEEPEISNKIDSLS